MPVESSRILTVQRTIGFALRTAQRGETHRDAKPLKGFGGAGVMEIVEASEGGAFRAVYTVTFREVVYCLHCFQKKSHRGIKTDRQTMDLIRRRLREAEDDYAQLRSER